MMRRVSRHCCEVYPSKNQTQHVYALGTQSGAAKGQGKESPQTQPRRGRCLPTLSGSTSPTQHKQSRQQRACGDSTFLSRDCAATWRSPCRTGAAKVRATSRPPEVMRNLLSTKNRFPAAHLDHEDQSCDFQCPNWLNYHDLQIFRFI